ncbi:hypothetical protein BGZ58_002002 [Dissophora ornata]|nr:hypothetical protein BGZ58_002002 [Dissophora ornata]
MDIHIPIKDDVLRGIVTSMLLAIVGGFFFIIVQSAREGITFWLFKHFPKNRGKLYVMATSRGGSYLDVLNLFNLLGGFPMFAVFLLMTIGVLGHAFSGLVITTKNIPTDLCTDNQCFSTGIGQDSLQGYTNITTIPSTKTSGFSLMNNFVLQPMTRLEYADGTGECLTRRATTTRNDSVGVDGWIMEYYSSCDSTPSCWYAKKLSLTEVTLDGINMLLNDFGVPSGKSSSNATKATYYGTINYQSWLAAANVTLISQNQGNVTQLEISGVTSLKLIKRVDADDVLNATLHNLRDNVGVLLDYGRELQASSQGGANCIDMTSTANNGDFLSYIATCFTMAVSQTQPIGMIKGYEQAGVPTPVISINLAWAIPLLLVTIVFLVPYTIVAIKLYKNDGKWLSYKSHVDAREYIINLCHSSFIVSEPRSDDEVLRIILEDHGDDGPMFELEKLRA